VSVWLIIPATDEAVMATVGPPEGVDDQFYALGDATPAVYRTLSDLMGFLAPDSTVIAFRDWERTPLATVQGDDRFTGFYITDSGRVGEGTTNVPRFFDSVAELVRAKLPDLEAWKES
jgi:hypothetical protein